MFRHHHSQWHNPLCDPTFPKVQKKTKKKVIKKVWVFREHGFIFNPLLTAPILFKCAEKQKRLVTRNNVYCSNSMQKEIINPNQNKIEQLILKINRREIIPNEAFWPSGEEEKKKTRFSFLLCFAFRLHWNSVHCSYTEAGTKGQASQTQLQKKKKKKLLHPTQTEIKITFH